MPQISLKIWGLEMLYSKIETCLRFITEQRMVSPVGGLHDELWCAAYNHLLQTFKYHRPAINMLHFGKSSLAGKTKLSQVKRVEWLRRYAERHAVRFHGERRNVGFLRWSEIVTFEKNQPEYFGPVGERIAHVLNRRRHAA